MPGWLTLKAHLHELNMETGNPSAARPPALAALRAEVRQDQIVSMEPASRAQRFAAKLIDTLLLLVPFLIYYTMVFDSALQGEMQTLQKDPAAMAGVIQRRIDTIQASGNMVPGIMGLFMNIVVITNVILLTLRGQTMGKICLGIQVVRFPSGARAGFVKAVLLRNMLVGTLIFGSLIFFGLMGLGLALANALMIFRQDRRCMHDLVADTLVVKISR